MHKLWVAALAPIVVASAAHAAIIPTLSSVGSVAGAYKFDYQATLVGDQGLKLGSRLVIFDFAGYVPGSVASTNPNFTATVENSSTGLLIMPGFADDPTLPNLVFTWKGANFHTSGGPYADVNFNGLSARSTLNNFALSFFSARAVKNNGLGPGGAGTATFNTGLITVPAAAPEPASWALMIAGFGLAGASLRRRRTAVAR